MPLVLYLIQLKSDDSICFTIVQSPPQMLRNRHKLVQYALNSSQIRLPLVSTPSKCLSIRLFSSQFNSTCLKSFQDVATCPQIVPNLSKCVELIVDRLVLSNTLSNSSQLPKIILIIVIIFQLSHAIILSKLF